MVCGCGATEAGAWVRSGGYTSSGVYGLGFSGLLCMHSDDVYPHAQP